MELCVRDDVIAVFCTLYYYYMPDAPVANTHLQFRKFEAF